MTVRLAAGALVAAAALSWSGTAAAEEADAAGPGDDAMLRYPPSSVRTGLIAGGIGVMGAAYGLSLACALTWDDVPGADALLIPVVGPWVSFVQNDCAPDDPDCGAIFYIRGMLLVIDGLVQAGGVGLLGEGIFMTTEADDGGADDAASLQWTVAPTITPSSTGLSLVGSF